MTSLGILVRMSSSTYSNTNHIYFLLFPLTLALALSLFVCHLSFGELEMNRAHALSVFVSLILSIRSHQIFTFYNGYQERTKRKGGNRSFLGQKRERQRERMRPDLSREWSPADHLTFDVRVVGGLTARFSLLLLLFHLESLNQAIE